MTRRSVLSAFAVAAALAGCGSDGGDDARSKDPKTDRGGGEAADERERGSRGEERERREEPQRAGPGSDGHGGY